MDISRHRYFYDRIAENEMNDRNRDEIRRRMIPFPYIDSVMVRQNSDSVSGHDYIYNYVYSLPVTDGMKKLRVRLESIVEATDRSTWRPAASDTLLFIVASLSDLVDRSALDQYVIASAETDSLAASGPVYTPQGEEYRLIEMIACADISVLLRGASGTGKEHIAAEIHARSHRKNKPYLAIDCGAISDELAASEFFGHQKGAFTGAESDKVGLFRAVNGGTLFLDEIGNLSYKTQMLLLRALQEKRCKPVGSTKEYSFDIRLVAATNENLEKAIGEGRFREDLFHRLNEFTLRIPTLAECREDILPLAYFFLKLTCAKAHKSFRGFDRLAEAALLEYPWPGNIRELKNVIGRAVLICQEQWISVSDLNLEISLPKEEETQWTEEEKEKALLLQTLEKTGDNRSKAARLLNVSRTTLYEKLRKYHIID